MHEFVTICHYTKKKQWSFTQWGECTILSGVSVIYMIYFNLGNGFNGALMVRMKKVIERFSQTRNEKSSKEKDLWKYERLWINATEAEETKIEKALIFVIKKLTKTDLTSSKALVYWLVRLIFLNKIK